MEGKGAEVKLMPSLVIWIVLLVGIILIGVGAVLLNVARGEVGEGAIKTIAAGIGIACGTLFAGGFLLKKEAELVRLGMIIAGAIILGLAVVTI